MMEEISYGDLMKPPKLLAHELRLGNLVLSPDTGKPVIVGLGHLNYIYEGIGWKGGQYEPIPLTPEILEKAGFVWNEEIKHWTITWGRNGVHFIKFDEYYLKFSFQLGGNGYYKVLDYLHQLQNLYFALTGEELNIEL